MKLSTVVDVRDRVIDFGDEQVFQHFIRKRDVQLKEKYINFFGYDIETIKMLNKKQFETFMKHKNEFEKQILESKPIIVSTIGKATTKALRDRKFKRVVIDEATMVRENEAFLGAIHAE